MEAGSPQLVRGSSRAERPLHAPSPLRTGHVSNEGAGVAVGATGSMQLLHKPLLRRGHPASVCSAWRGHFDPIHVRNVMGV
ncbi:hypothetical protein EYF80_018569 [Liparis tanakae]|uniref:Uncharacterized protein n=1 Tax=Liparis tanakae TaxID=230148 RepID=A0A4Z2I082_9TELE|nr:hypothetical protein EYF80_018569 [Liparis tanakae]